MSHVATIVMSHVTTIPDDRTLTPASRAWTAGYAGHRACVDDANAMRYRCDGTVCWGGSSVKKNDEKAELERFVSLFSQCMLQLRVEPHLPNQLGYHCRARAVRVCELARQTKTTGLRSFRKLHEDKNW